MSEEKKKKKRVKLAGKLKIKCKKGKVLPLYIDGKYVRVGSEKDVEFDIDKQKYETKIELSKAVEAGHILGVE